MRRFTHLKKGKPVFWVGYLSKMWEISNSVQALTFLYSCILGGIFCLLYDFLRALRYVFKFKNIFVLFQDVFYFFVCSVITFIFLLATTNGEIRGFVICGILLGYVIGFLTFSKMFLKILKFIILKMYSIFRFLNSIFNKFLNKVNKFLKNMLNSCKKGLKKVKGMLYTR